MIKALDAEQGGPNGGLVESTVGSEPVEGRASDPSPINVPPENTPLLTLEEKRRILARIARVAHVNVLDCFDESGAFDIVRAKRVLPPGAVRHIAIHEITRLNAEGQPVTERHIDVRLVDPVSALRLDDLLERRREPNASHSKSSSSSNTKIFSWKDFKLLTEKTMALDDANQSIELLKKALAEMDDRELQLSKELEEKDRQLGAAQRDTGCQPVQEKPETSTGCQAPGSQKPSSSHTLRKVEGESVACATETLSSSDLSPSNPLLPGPTQHDTGCQPVSSKTEIVGQPNGVRLAKPQSEIAQRATHRARRVPRQSLRLPKFPNAPDFSPAFDAENSNASTPPLPSAEERDTGCQPVQMDAPKAPSHAEGQPPSGVTRLEALTKLKNPTPAELKEMEALCFLQEAEEVKNTSGSGAFSAWLRARGIDPATYRSPPPGFLPAVKIRMARQPARPPP